jgi:hypothetical protein
MRKIAIRTASLLIALAAVAGANLTAQPVDPICPFCITGYKCCIQGSHASCIPESRPCP